MDSPFELKVIPLLCPDCGRSLPAGEDDALFYCADCAVAWELEGTGLARREVYHLAGEGTLILPFWILPFRVTTREGTVGTVEDYRGLSGAVGNGNGPARSGLPLLYVPAYPFQSPLHLIRAGRLLTLRQPVMTIAGSRPSRIHSVVFREEDARKTGAAILLATVTEDRKRALRFLESFSCTFGKGRLCTIPFAENGSKFYHAAMNLEL